MNELIDETRPQVAELNMDGTVPCYAFWRTGDGWLYPESPPRGQQAELIYIPAPSSKDPLMSDDDQARHLCAWHNQHLDRANSSSEAEQFARAGAEGYAMGHADGYSRGRAAGRRFARDHGLTD